MTRVFVQVTILAFGLACVGSIAGCQTVRGTSVARAQVISEDSNSSKWLARQLAPNSILYQCNPQICNENSIVIVSELSGDNVLNFEEIKKLGLKNISNNILGADKILNAANGSVKQIGSAVYGKKEGYSFASMALAQKQGNISFYSYNTILFYENKTIGLVSIATTQLSAKKSLDEFKEKTVQIERKVRVSA